MTFFNTGYETNRIAILSLLRYYRKAVPSIRRKEAAMNNCLIDIKENALYRLDSDLLAVLLQDHSSGKNIIWATDNYAHRGIGFQRHDHIEIQAITGHNGNVVKPRVEKTKKEQLDRIKQKAEVFTPSWICNKQNNLVDNAWFGEDNVFNTEHEKTWTATEGKITFPTPTGKTWEEYVSDNCLEITCGEAPYLVSRYDAVTGEYIELPRRIGRLDRKMRLVAENTETEAAWLKWATVAFQSVYGFEWQGDNVLIARENLLLSYVDYYYARFEKEPEIALLRKIAEIISWNIWQMDGLKFVIPESCEEEDDGQLSLYDDGPPKRPCEGCLKNARLLHTGVYCKIKDWKANEIVTFVSLLNNGGEKHG